MGRNFAGMRLRGRPFTPTEDLREADFTGATLRGVNFKGLDLTGAKFVNADIRSTNFTDAILHNADFTGAQAGLQKRWMWSQLILIFLLSTCLNFASILVETVSILSLFTSEIMNYYNIFPGIMFVVLHTFVFLEIARQGLTTRAVGTILTAVAVAVAGTGAGAVAGAGAGAGAVAIAVAIAVALTIAGAVLGAIAAAGIVSGVVSSAVAGAVVITITIAIAAAVVVTIAAAVAVVVAAAVAVAVAVLIFSLYVAWRTRKGDVKFALARTFGVAVGAIGGTSFCGADLTAANFTDTKLKSANFNDSKKKPTILKHTCWQNAKHLDRARVGTSLLSDPAVRELLVTQNGYKKSYVGANLDGANLNGANLEGANLKRTNLNHSMLRQAHLKDANLAKTLATGTDFTGAYLTGVCLESWNIDHTTILENVDCQFVFLLQKENKFGIRERRPSSGTFGPGEFTKLFEEVLNTIDLIFRDGVDWRAFMAAFKTIQVENQDAELTVQSIENKGDGVIVVRVEVTPEADKTKLHSELVQAYDLVLKALESKYRSELQVKDREIVLYREKSAEMTEIVKQLANRPFIQQDFKGPTYGVAGNVEGNQNIFVSEPQQTLAQAAQEIQQLLKQLETSNPAATPQQKADFVTWAIGPDQRKRFLSALNAGWKEALKELLDNPYFNVAVAILEQWQQTE